MMIDLFIKVGTDIEENNRFVRMMEKEHFMKRVYSELEQEYIDAHPHPIRASAGIFCAKEAFFKAVGTGIMLPLNHVEVRHSESGAPYIRLYGALEERYSCYSFALSISHTGEYSTAVCIAYDHRAEVGI